jgi:hypothetical protein
VRPPFAKFLLPVLALVALAVPAAATADAVRLASAADLPWVDPAHGTELEVLAGQIASTIAKRPVTIRCEGDYDWRTLILEQGGNPDSELGYVAAWWFADGRLSHISGFTELSGGVCLALQQFGAAQEKPTKCSGTATERSTVYKPAKVKVLRRVTVHGRKVERPVWVVRRIPTTVTTQVAGLLRPCYQGAEQSVLPMTDPYWSDYRRYALAMLVLAHESIHLGGAVGGVLSSGLAVGDQQAEAHANCWGLQWIPTVAEQLGATPDDASAIAAYAFDHIYPGYQGTAYWSADCRPGGAMDIRPAGSPAWP